MRGLIAGGALLLLVGLDLPAVAQELPNEVRNPSGTLTVRTPPLLQPGGRLDTPTPQPGWQWVIVFSDDLCRQFVVQETVDDAPDGTLESRVRERLVPALEQMGVRGVELRMVELATVGEAAFLHYRQATVGPCVRIGGPPPDAEVVAYAFLRSGLRYAVSYYLGDIPNRLAMDVGFGVRTAPATEILDDFMRGLTFSSAGVSSTLPAPPAGQNVGYSLEQFVADNKSAAERGDVRAQVTLGIMYESGFGVSPDPAKAFEWFLAAANRDASATQSLLVGRAYADGRGVPRDEDEALVWFHKGAESGLQGFSSQPIFFAGGPEGAIKAAESGMGLAQLTAGMMYLTGHGAEQNDTEAARWLAKVAGQALGGVGAGVSLALMYEAGRGGLPMDNAEAMRLYRRAAEQEVAGSKEVLTFFCLSTYGRADCGRTR